MLRRRTLMLALAALSATALPLAVARAQAPPPGPPNAVLERLEQESVDDAGVPLRIDPNPAGKIIGQIHVRNQEVFSRRDWYFQLLNVFHRTTRADVLARELLVRPGQPYDQTLIDETIRNLQTPQPLTIGTRTVPVPELSSVVVILPLLSPQPGQVDLLVVTRDIWSLRFNTNFEFQQNTLSYLSTSLSENNLFGWRKFLSLGFTMDQGTMGFGPTYFDPNIHGTRLTLYTAAFLWYSRATHDYEGNSQSFDLRYPLFSLASRWGGGVDVTHGDVVIRRFRGNALRAEDLTATPGVTEAIPDIYRRKTAVVDSSLVRGFGAGVIQRVTVGHYFESRRAEVLPDSGLDAETARLFLAEYAPVSEQRSEPYVRYEVFTPRYAILRNLDSFELRENRRLGPRLALRVGYGVPGLGADFAALALAGAVSYAIGPGGSFAFIQIDAGARLRDGTLIDQQLTGHLFAATPLLWRTLRVVVDGVADSIRADTQRRRFLLGGATGLRGYAIGDFDGTSMAVGHVELRSAPLAIWSQRLGALLFYDVGHAAASFSKLYAHHDLGAGLRWLIPQLNTAVLRVDWAVATQSTAFTKAGLPGRFTAGFEQVF